MATETKIGNSKPFVLRNKILSWEASKWTPEKLAQILTDKKVAVRFGSKTHSVGKILWETESPRRELTLTEFLSWQNRDTAENLVREFDPNKHWGYMDYKYLFELVDEKYLKNVDWSVFGLDIDGKDSTIWLGTAGAYTPCHYDTYGFNLHAQIYGHKRWVLFSPGWENLEPTRIPYEESSVFSCLDIMSAPEQLRNSQVYMETLGPGDVLYVPPGWWHFVQCMDTCISVNTWVPLPSDGAARFTEALTRSIVGLLTENMVNVELAPSENEINADDGLDILNTVVRCQKAEQQQRKEFSQCCDEPKEKSAKIDGNSSSSSLEAFLTKYSEEADYVELVTFGKFSDAMVAGPLTLDSPSGGAAGNLNETNLKKEDLLRAILHPSTVANIAKLLNIDN